MAYWILLILAMAGFGIGLAWLFNGNYSASTPSILLAIFCLLLAIVTPKGKKQ